MKCPMTFGNPCSDVGDECFGRKCAWWVQKQRTAYNHVKGCTEVRGIEAEGCAVAFAATGVGGKWMLNDGGAE